MNYNSNLINKEFFFSCARHAFAESLTSLNIKNNEFILLPDFICRDLLSSINEISINYKFYSVNKNLEPNELPVDNKIKAVLVVNYFGFPQDLDKFNDYCRHNRCILIEDNAHGYLSRDVMGVELGKRTDIGFTSFRKTLPVFNGAALYINNNEINFSKISIIEPSNEILPLRFQMKTIFRKIESITKISFINYLEEFSKKIRFFHTGNYLPKVKESAEEIIGYKKNIHISALYKIFNFHKKKQIEIERRRNLFLNFKKILIGKDIIPIFQSLPDFTSPYGFPFIASDEIGKIVSKIAQKNGYSCNKWPDLPKEIESVCPDYYKQIYFINFLR